MDAVADFIRSEQARLAQLWEHEVRRDVASRPVLLDHIPAFLTGLADWIEGNTAHPELFTQLTESPALLDLGYGVGLETLTREYSKLRGVLVRELLVAVPCAEIRDTLVRLQLALDQAIEEAIKRYAARREKVRERFIGILGHDLRDPLSTVTISAKVLAGNQQLERKDRLIAARIVRACDRMQRMINDVLDFARGHLGSGIPANPAPNDMREICCAAADEIVAAHPQRDVHVEVAGNLHGAFDRDRVHQAITNLLANAIHHGEGPIDIAAYYTDDQIVTEVTSHGPPIPDTLVDRIFDPFAHADVDSHQGLGLGLYIVHQIAIAHGAVCEVSSNAEATTFRIHWPRSQHRNRVAG